MIEIIGMSGSDVTRKSSVANNAIEEIQIFIFIAVSHSVFLRYKPDVQFNLIHELARIFNLNLSDKWEVSWKHYWTVRFKHDWLCSVIEGLKSCPFEVFRIDERVIIENMNYYEIMERLNEIFPYVNEIEEKNIEEETAIQEETVKEFLHSDTEDLLPRKKKLRVKCKKKDALFDHMLLGTLDEEHIVDGKETPNASKSYYIESYIKEVHQRSKGSIIFIQMKVTIYNIEDITKEIVTVRGYDEYDFLAGYHTRFKARNYLHKKCSDIIKGIIDYRIPELDTLLTKENYHTENRDQTTIVKEGGNLNFNKFIEFWKTIRS